MSRTTLSSDGPEGFTDHRGNGCVRQITPSAPSPFDKRVQLLVRERLKSLINAGEARTGGQENRQDLLRKLPAFGVLGSTATTS